MRLYEWKVCVLVTNPRGESYGVWTYVRAEDAEAAAENAEILVGGEVVMVECLDEDKRIADRVAA